MPVDTAGVVAGLQTAGIDADIEDCGDGPVVTLNPGDASTFLDMLTGGAPAGEHAEIITALAQGCPHRDNDCIYCGWGGDDDNWPDAEHDDTCLWARASRWVRRHQNAHNQQQ